MNLKEIGWEVADWDQWRARVNVGSIKRG